MTFVVAGVSGNTGSVVAEALLARREDVRVVLRDPSKAAPWTARGAEVAVADLDDAPALARALRGARGAVAPMLANLGFGADLTSAYVELVAGIRSGILAFEGGHRRVEAHTPLDVVLRPRIAG